MKPTHFNSFLIKKLRWTLFSLVACIIVLLAADNILASEVKGQIINVNQNYQIAFTDLGSSVLKQGEIVRVSLDSTEFLYMEVLESSSILSKLGPSRNETFKTNLKDFANISVGNVVTKMSLTDGAPPQIKPEPPIEHGPSTAEMDSLRNQLTEAMDEIVKLKAENDTLTKQINELTFKQNQSSNSENVLRNKNTQEVLSQLKLRLEKMDKAISQ